MKILISLLFVGCSAFSAVSEEWSEHSRHSAQTFCSKRIPFTNVKYKQPGETSANELTIIKYDDGDFIVTIKFDDDPDHKIYKQRFNRHGLCDLTFSFYSYRGKEISKISMFLRLVDEIKPLGKIKQEIIAFMGIRLADKAVMLELAKAGKHDEATRYAIEQSDLDQDLLWELGEYYYELQEFEAALDIYQEIDEENSHYKEAAERCDSIISKILDLNDQGAYQLTQEEKKNHVKHRFKFALQANNARLAGRLFEELFSVSLPDALIQKFKGDYETLMGIGKVFSDKNLAE